MDRRMLILASGNPAACQGPTYAPSSGGHTHGSKTSFAVSRRNFLIRGGALAAGAALLGPAQLLAADKKEAAAADVTPTEDLMREHGVLRRLLLIYDEIDRTARWRQGIPAAGAVRGPLS